MIEYRVRKVSRFIITRYEESGNGGNIKTWELFENNTLANEVACALGISEPGASVVLYDQPEPYSAQS